MGIPKAADFSDEKITAHDVYRNRIIAPLSNGTGSTVIPGSQMNIYLNTSTPSSLLDPHSCYFQGTLGLWTENPYVDYCSFGMEGIASLFREFRVFNQGNPLEEILRYGLAYRVFTFLSGAMQQEFRLFMGQKRRRDMPDTHGNLYTDPPPMCDHDGRIMHGPSDNFVRIAHDDAVTNRRKHGIHNWPESYVPDKEYIDRYQTKSGNVRVQDFFHFLSNVKNIPIGMKAKYSNETKQWTDLSELKTVKTYYNIVMPFMSGIVGSLATKFLPTGLISNQAMFISVTLAHESQVVYLSMDPCRRIPGTHRDYVSIIGSDGNGNNPSDVRTHVWNKPNEPYYTAFAAGTGLDDAFRLRKTIVSGNMHYKTYDVTVPATLPIFKPWRFSGVIGSTGTASTASVQESAISNLQTTNDMACYGSPYESSRPQTLRINTNYEESSCKLPESGKGLPSDSFNYTLQDVQFVGDEIILPPEVARNVVMQVEQEGGIRIKTNSVRTYPLNVNTAATQTIIIPAKIANADSIIVSFQNTRQLTVQEGLYYDSNSSINPFASIKPITNDVGRIGKGGQKIIRSRMKDDAWSFQLRIGSTYYPTQAIKKASDWSIETLKTMHGLNDLTRSLDTNAYMGFDGPSEYENDGFFTPFVDRSLLDDQVYKLPHNRYGDVLTGVLIPPSSNSLLCFNLNGWNGVSEMASSGMYLKDGTVSLLLTGAEGLAVPGENYTGTAIIPHEALFNILPGGQSIWSY